VKAAVDTNILAYAEGIDDPKHGRIARDVLNRVVPAGAAVAAQTLGELFNVLRRKANYTPEQARLAVSEWRSVFEVVGTTPDLFARAVDLAADHKLNIWDSVILSAASAAGCRLLLSEDMQEGFTWGGVTVVNPFTDEPHPLLATALAPR
jgi:predicted nucleic acid-binding protein